jgi:hypothetical protein
MKMNLRYVLFLLILQDFSIAVVLYSLVSVFALVIQKRIELFVPAAFKGEFRNDKILLTVKFVVP